MAKLRKDLTGKTFGYLDVLEFHDRRVGKALWLCRCRCGNSTVADGHNLTAGHTTSCGCKRFEPPSAVVKHGLSRSRAHGIWRKMLERCNSPSCESFDRYGGRGIKVCDRWLEFSNFYVDMGDPPDGHSIDRMNNDLGYSPENCRWATTTEQSMNRRCVLRIESGGETLTVREWAERFGLKSATIKHRIAAGWPHERWFEQHRKRTIKKRDNLGRIAS